MRGGTRLATATGLTAGALLVAVNAQVEIRDLGGLNLRCRVITERPSFYRGLDRNGYTGLGVAYLEKLEKALNFDCGELAEYQSRERKYEGFSGLTRYFKDCAKNGDSSGCDFDMAVAGVAETSDRLGRVDFPAPYAYDTFSVVQRLDSIKNSNAVDGPLLLAPFSFWVWMALVSVILSHVLVSVLDVEFLPEEKGSVAVESDEQSFWERAWFKLLKTRVLRKVRFAVFRTLNAMLGSDDQQIVNGTEKRSPPSRQRILLLIAQFTGLFLILCYEAGLVVQLFAENPVSDFRSIDDVKSCRIDARDVCIPSGDAVEVFWRGAVETARGECRQGSFKDDQPKFVDDTGRFKDRYSAGLELVSKGDCKYFMAMSSTLSVAAENEYCNVLTMVGDPFFSVAVSFVLPKDSNITLPISAATLDFQHDGSLPNLNGYGVSRECKTATSAARLTWSRVKIVFLVTWTLHGLMVIYMVINRRKSVCKRGSSEGSALSVEEKRFTLPILLRRAMRLLRVP